MARAAGGGRDYTIAIVDTDGNVRTRLDGFESVTSILKSTSDKSGPLMGWAWNLAVKGVVEMGVDASALTYDELKAMLKDAGHTTYGSNKQTQGRGNTAHDLAEHLLDGVYSMDKAVALVADMPEDIRGYGEAVLAYVRDFRERGATTLATEQTLASLTHEFAGTLDHLYSEPTEGGPDAIVVSDFKTSKAIYPDQLEQCDAYAIAVEEMRRRKGKPVTVDFVEVVRLGANGKYQTKRRAPDRETFLARVALRRAVKAAGTED